MAQQRKISADAARQRAADQMASGIGDIAGGVTATPLKGVTGEGSFGENLKAGTIWE